MTKKRKKKIWDRKFKKLIDLWMARSRERGLSMMSEEELEKMGFVKSNAKLKWYLLTK